MWNDILVTGTTQQAVNDFDEVAKKMDMKDFGTVKKFLGIKADASQKGKIVMD
jgi:hypothetical protein